MGSSHGINSVLVKARDSNFSLKMNLIIVSKLSHFLPAKKELKLADPYFYNPSPIDMTIRSDYLPLINIEGVRYDIANWKRENLDSGDIYLYLLFETTAYDSENITLHEQMKMFWEVENLEGPLTKITTIHTTRIVIRKQLIEKIMFDM